MSQPLLKISDVAFASSVGENRLRLFELKANIARLRAEAGQSDFEADPDVAREAPALMRAARDLFESRRRELEQTLQILQEQARQQRSELTEASAKRESLRERLSLMREELELKLGNSERSWEDYLAGRNTSAMELGHPTVVRSYSRT